MCPSPDDRTDRVGESGFSLIELMVVMLLLGIVMPIAYGLLFTAGRETSEVGNAYSAQSQAQLTMDTLTKQLEAAAPPVSGGAAIVSATASSITFYSDLGSTADPSARNGNAPAEIAITTAPCGACATGAVELVESVTQPSSTGTYTATPATAVIGTGIVVPTANPSTGCGTTAGMFQYWTSTGACVPFSSGSIATASLATIAQVDLSFSAVALSHNAQVGLTPTTVIDTDVPLRNVEYSDANS